MKAEINLTLKIARLNRCLTERKARRFWICVSVP